MNCLITRWNVEPSYPKPFSPVAKALLHCKLESIIRWAEMVPEVLRSLGYGLAVKTNDDAAKFLIAVCDVKVDLCRQSAMFLETQVAHTL
jgi:hypothetical protein